MADLPWMWITYGNGLHKKQHCHLSKLFVNDRRRRDVSCVTLQIASWADIVLCFFDQGFVTYKLCEIKNGKLPNPLAPANVIDCIIVTHNERDSVSNHQRLYCLLNRLFRCRSKIASKLRVTGFCAWNSPVTVEFPAQMASNAENVSIWWRHHVKFPRCRLHETCNVCCFGIEVVLSTC